MSTSNEENVNESTTTNPSNLNNNQNKASTSSSSSSSSSTTSNSNKSKYLFIFVLIVIAIYIQQQLKTSDKNKSVDETTEYLEFINKYEEQQDLDNLNNWIFDNNVFSSQFINKLNDLSLKDEFHTLNGEYQEVESAGEAQPIGHSDCFHPYMTPNKKGTICHFSQRIDIGRHYFSTGGFHSNMETFEKMIARALPLHKNVINELSKEDVEYLKNDPKLKSYTKKVCDNADILSIHEFNLVILVAGMEVPTHVDAPYFIGADRTTLPQWLLVLMRQSHLFDHLFIKEAKNVLWLSEHDQKQIMSNGGHLYLYPYKNSEPWINRTHVLLKSDFNQLAVFDGTLIPYGVSRFMRDKMPKLFNKSHKYRIKYDEDTKLWQLIDEYQKIIETYTKDTIKLSAIWRIHCFESEEQKSQFYDSLKPEKRLNLEDIAKVFKKDLKSKNKLPTDDIKYLELWTIVLKEYLIYPVNKNTQTLWRIIFDFNYCLLPNMMPQAINKYILDPLLKHAC